MSATRRTFLQSAAAALAAPSDRVRIGLIGCGGISVADSNAFLAHRECEIAAICDIDDARLKKTVDRLAGLGRTRPETASDFRRVVERKDIDVCLVCTPDHWHALPTIAAMQAGKDVYVEKPLATTIGEGRAMRDVARERGRIWIGCATSATRRTGLSPPAWITRCGLGRRRSARSTRTDSISTSGGSGITRAG